MIYKHNNEILTGYGNFIYYFDQNIYYAEGDMGHPYVPTDTERQAMLAFYTSWCNKYNQKQNAGLMECLNGSPDVYKTALLSYLDREAAAFENNLNKDMFFTSSLGFRCNGDRRTKDNLQDLISFFDLQAKDGTVSYRDYDNEERLLTKEQLQVLLVEHVGNGQNLYQQKWAYETAINEAQTLDALHEMEIKFVMQTYVADNVDSSDQPKPSVPSGEENTGESTEGTSDEEQPGQTETVPSGV